jgi:hypothetical protein
VNNELEGTWKKELVVLYEVLSRHFYGKLKKPQKQSIRIVYVPTEV